MWFLVLWKEGMTEEVANGLQLSLEGKKAASMPIIMILNHQPKAYKFNYLCRIIV
ncbi:MAG: hypothetical protein ACJ71I_16950 [Nitrososphaeraceae archaeon]